LSLLVEQRYKRVRGRPTEGRFLTLEMVGLALANLDGETVGAAAASEAHAEVRQRWVLHTVGGGEECCVCVAVGSGWEVCRCGRGEVGWGDGGWAGVRV